MSPEQILMFVAVWPATGWLLIATVRLVTDTLKEEWK